MTVDSHTQPNTEKIFVEDVKIGDVIVWSSSYGSVVFRVERKGKTGGMPPFYSLTSDIGGTMIKGLTETARVVR